MCRVSSKRRRRKGNIGGKKGKYEEEEEDGEKDERGKQQQQQRRGACTEGKSRSFQGMRILEEPLGQEAKRSTEKRNHNSNGDQKSLWKVGTTPSGFFFQKCFIPDSYIPHTEEQYTQMMRNMIFFKNGYDHLLTHRKKAVKEGSIQHSPSIFYMAWFG